MSKRNIDLINILQNSNTDESDENHAVSKKNKSSNIVDDFFDQLFNKEKNSDNEQLKKDLSDEDMKKYSEQYNKIKVGIKDRLVSEVHIIRSNIPFNEKVKLMELFNIMKNTERNTYERYELKNLIKQKLEEDTHLTDDDMELEKELKQSIKSNLSVKAKILKSTHNKNIKQILYKRYSDICDLGESTEEYQKTKTWIENVLSLPTEIKPLFKQMDNNKLVDKIKEIQTYLTEYIYGQNNAKERIIEILCAMYSNENYGRSIGMLGGPGTGKTSFAKCLAHVLDLPFYQISLGGMKDSSYILGHGETYIGATYGEIVRGLISMNQKNGILFFDEFDKIADMNSDVSNTFLHILDYTQNNNFKDQYMANIPIDLSNLIIIVSLNNIHKVNHIVADRIHVVEFDDYDFKDKVKIGLNYFIPKIQNELNMNDGDIVMTKSIMKHIIWKIDDDNAGVRSLEKTLRKLYEKLNVLITTQNSDDLMLSYRVKNFSIPYKLTRDAIDILVDDLIE